MHACDAMHALPEAAGVPNPQLHAWWHALTAVACYAGPAFLKFRRATLLGRGPRVEFWWGVVPVVVVAAAAAPAGRRAGR